MNVNTLDRYVTGQFLRLFFGFVLGAPILFVIGDITDRLDEYLEWGVTVGQVALSYVYQMPMFVLWSFPVAALIATVFTMNGMTRNFEVAAAKAGGVSFYRLVAPLSIMGVLLTVAALGLSELVPVTNRMRAEVLGRVDDNSSAVRADFVYRDSQGYVYLIRRLTVESGRMYGVTVEREPAAPGRDGVQITAKQARYQNETGWTLQDGYVHLVSGDNASRTFAFEKLRPPHLTETPAQLVAERKDPDNMRYAELGRFITMLRRSGGRPLELMVERAQKLALPVATLIIILFAAPLATSSRRGGTAYGVGISLLITVVYLMLFKVAGAAGASGTLHPQLAAWLPNGLFLAAAGVLLARVRT